MKRKYRKGLQRLSKRQTLLESKMQELILQTNVAIERVERLSKRKQWDVDMMFKLPGDNGVMPVVGTPKLPPMLGNYGMTWGEPE